MSNKQTIYKKDSKGKIRYLAYWTEGNILYSERGEKGGKAVVSNEIIEGKNIGKKNETTPAEQAIKEKESKVERKLRRDYSRTIEELETRELLLPMKAKSDMKYIVFPALVQPKLNGFRCLIDCRGEDLVISSKSGAESFELPLISAELQKDQYKGLVLDGELYIHGKELNEISHIIKNPELQQDLEFHIFDIVNDDFCDSRLKQLASLEVEGPIQKVVTLLASHEKDFNAQHNLFIIDGYEGSIIRNLKGAYKKGGRSFDLVKRKDFQDEEFLVVGIVEGVGTNKGLGIPVVKMPNGKTMECPIKGSFEVQKEIWENKESYIGRYLTVKFHSWTVNGYLKDFRGIRFRDEFDMDSSSKTM